ncbi:expansin EXLX1 family cellulose-binding protein [Streptomyces sp. YU58]|uniref:expansin EXLX1 family cellulose-binding protein n=1 Tax=Streptomyces sp. SX92 TaxID=3158972 RepID=UPI0027BA0FD0|nr:expansin EXLX1 family cellulose-binding protein [Streptomyces coralus]WLW55322.1 expansin EXLX1 family cellulose-binding protein [Streptomyces coralus]
MAPRSQHRAARKRRTALVVVSVAALALVVSAVVALAVAVRPDRKAADERPAPAPVAGAEVTRAPTTEPEPTPSSAPPSRKAAAIAPSAPETPAAKRPAATKTPRPSSGPASLAGRIRPAVTYSGVATFYDAGNGDGACLFGPTDDVMTAAMNTTDYETSKACGAHVLVRTASGASVTVRITNECPGDCAPGQLDLSAEAFAKLADPTAGRIPITWTLLSPDRADTLSVRYKTGSSRYWCALQVLGHRNPVARLEVNSGGSWVALPRTEYNYFLSEKGTGCGGEIRVTDIYGEQLTVDGIALQPDVAQPTRVQFAAH